LVERLRFGFIVEIEVFIMDGSKAQEILNKIGVGKRVKLIGKFNYLPGDSVRTEKLYSFDTISVTIGRPTGRDLIEGVEREVLKYSDITSISELEDPFGLSLLSR
jgi:hypothetical protein